MVRASLLGIVVLFATEALAAEAPRQPAFDEAELVSGAALELAPLASPLTVPTRDEVFELDADMRAFLTPLADIRDPRHKLLTLERSVGAARNVLARVCGGHTHGERHVP